MAKLPHRKLLIVLVSLFGVLLVAGAVVRAVLDSVLLKEAKAQANAFSQKIGRPISIGGVSTRILSGVAVRVSGVEIGPGPGEGTPLLILQRAEVKPALLKVLLSHGKTVTVRSVDIEGLTINVVRFADGTTNIERLQSKLAENSEPEVRGGDKREQAPSERPTFELDHFAFKEGTVHFVEQGKAKGGVGSGPATELAIRHLEVLADNLRAGKPLDLRVKAAVLAEQQNLELHLTTAPLPASLIPTPQQMVLKIQPIDLKPIAPFLPRSLGLQEGRLSADLNADLGAAIPGGEGETRVRGSLNALGLQFAAAEGGRPIDVSLDAALQGNASKGDLQIDRLKLDVGSAGITGKGRVLALNSGQPRVEGFEVVGHDLDPARIAAFIPLLKRQLKGQVAGPIGLDIRGAGTEGSQAIEIKLDLTPVRLAIPETLSKAAGARMTFLLHLRGAPAGNVGFDLHADLAGADLRPGESLDKPPGQTLDLSLSGTKSGGSGNKAGMLKVQLTEMTAHVRDSVLTGNGSVERSGSGKQTKTEFELSLHSPRMNLDQLLLPTKKKEKPPLDPSLFAGVRGHAVVKVDSLRQSKLDFDHLVADVKMVDDELTFQTLSIGAFGGKISAQGTKIRLAHRKAPFKAIAQVENLNVAQAASLATDRKILAGTFSGDLEFSGVGTDQADLIRSLSGSLKGHLLEGTFLGKDVIASISEPLAKALPRGLAIAKRDDGATSLGKDLPFGITVEKGVAKLKAPLHISRPEAELTLGGGIQLAGNLDLAGTIALAPSTINALTQGKVTPSQAIPIGLKITGLAWKPVVADVDLNAAIASIAKQAATGALGRFIGTRARPGGEVLQNPTERAQEKLQQEKQRAGDAAREEADKARNQAEEEAKKRLKGIFGK